LPSRGAGQGGSRREKTGLINDVAVPDAHIVDILTLDLLDLRVPDMVVPKSWVASAGTPGVSAHVVGRGIVTDSAGNGYVTGSYMGKAWFGPKLLGFTSAQDLFVTKLSPEGSFLWTTTAGGEQDQSPPPERVGDGGVGVWARAGAPGAVDRGGVLFGGAVAAEGRELRGGEGRAGGLLEEGRDHAAGPPCRGCGSTRTR
jgi:hypothetical protein